MMHKEPLNFPKKPPNPHHHTASCLLHHQHLATDSLLGKAILVLKKNSSSFSQKAWGVNGKSEDFFKIHEHLAKGWKKESTKFYISTAVLARPIAKYLEPKGMGFAKTFQIYFMIVFHRHLRRPWGLSLLTWQKGLGDTGLGRVGLKSVAPNHIPLNCQALESASQVSGQTSHYLQSRKSRSFIVLCML